MPRDPKWAGLVSNVVNAVDNLVTAGIMADKPDREMDDMGTYFEEQALDKALNELVDNLIAEADEDAEG